MITKKTISFCMGILSRPVLQLTLICVCYSTSNVIDSIKFVSSSIRNIVLVFIFTLNYSFFLKPSSQGNEARFVTICYLENQPLNTAKVRILKCLNFESCRPMQMQNILCY